ncbi:bifunctional folylpolyglutamate synthase/dihydrofolate synthase [Actinomarinicola tropica]|uniref:tetrahydrofolate synthase n=1 Tax=Actinomarinicola tropica TaxID=2789776 RepID=A0A5Q2RMC8_9ACTN|nr:folylpolyglutamate synthase/dihydrofolate synthase family protein [Actinomarinicola tropica]QGG95711.1 bifunctional folylpolyglutamate synthase/dihydrofolate synthase [Actinomarinicola tropica]
MAWLDRHINLEANAGRPTGASLDRMRSIVHVLGDPHRAYPSIHLTGTNGKGSVARMTTALLQASGLTVGTYTSPHLERINERMSRNLEPVDDDELADAIAAVAAIEPIIDGPPSHFEILTAAAFHWFADVAVDVAVLEVGLLGRYDCTNVVDAPVSVLTRVAADHTDRSEGWRRAIAEEKVGIVKPGSTFVLGETDPELRDIFDAAPAETMWVRDADFAVESNQVAVGGRLLDLRTPGGRYTDLFLPLHGAHQGDNAVVALTAVEGFFGRPLDEDVVTGAFATVTVPGRLEPVAHAPSVLLDAAHNPDGAESLTAALAESFTVVGSRYLVVGLLAQQDTEEMLQALGAPGFDLVVVCTPPGSPRARPAADVARVAESLGCSVEVVPEPVEAVARAVALADEEDLVVVAGSIYVVGAVRAAYSRTAEAMVRAKEAAEAEDELGF